MGKHKQWINAAVCASMVLFGTGTVCAQDFPSKPLHILTQGTGGGADFASRMIAGLLTSSLGQQVIVDNRPGVIPIEFVAKAPADGYSMLVYANGMWTEPYLRDNVSYDPVRDFAPVTLVSTAPNILVVHPSLPVKNVKELIALAKARPGELNYASGGGGTPNHLAAELFREMAHINIVHVPYKSAGAAVTGLIGGEVQMALPNAAGVVPYIKSGKLKPLAVTSARTSILFPNLPTVSASGLPGYESAGIVGAFVAAKTPPALVNKLNQEIARVLARQDVKDKFMIAGVEAIGNSPDEFAAIMKADMAKWIKVIKEAHIHVE